MSQPAYLTHLKGPGDWWRSTSPQALGVMHLIFVSVAFLLGAAFALLGRAEFLVPARDLIARDTYGQMVTLHGVMLMVLCAAPAIQAVFGNFVLPKMLGAEELAHPALGRWTMQLHGWALLAAVLSTAFGAIDGGWTLLPPWSTAAPIPALLFAISLHLMGVSIIGLAVNHLATIFRHGGGSMPFFARALGVGSGFALVVAPALAAASVLLFAEATGRADLFADSMPGYESLLAFFGRGVVVMMLCGAAGVIAEVTATAARKAPHGMGTTTIALALTGGLYLLGGCTGSVAENGVASFFGLLAAVPATMLAVNFLYSLHGGAIRFDAGFLLALIAVLGLVTGGVAGIFLSAPMTGEYLRGTGFATAQLHMLLAGDGLSAFLAGLIHWWPLITGKRLGARRPVFAAVLHFAGLQMTFLPLFVLGARGTTARAQSLAEGAFEPARLAAVGALMLFTGLALFTLEFLGSILSDTNEDANPHGAATGEWSAAANYDFKARGRSET
jgi:cytochrome c oxidase subunit 1